MLKDILHLVD